MFDYREGTHDYNSVLQNCLKIKMTYYTCYRLLGPNPELIEVEFPGGKV